MRQCKWLSRNLSSKVLISVILVMATSLGLGTGLSVAADSPAPETEWEKTFGDLYSIAYSVQQTTDGGYILAGETYSSGTGSVDFYLVKTDVSGNVAWPPKTFGGSGDDVAYSVQQTTDGGYIIAGETNSFGAGYDDIYLVKTDDSGNVAWPPKTFGGSGFDNAYSVQQTTDSGYIIAGSTDSYGTEGDVYLIKTDSFGNTEWWNNIGGSEDEYAYSVQETTDGGYIIAGETYSNDTGSYDFYLAKTDDSGNMEWEKTFGGSGYEAAWSVQQTTDGGYIIAGFTTSFGTGEDEDAYLVKTDSSGNMEWEKTFGGSGDDVAYSVQQTTDGGYIIAGSTESYGAGSTNAYLVKVSPEINTPAGEDVSVSLESGTVTFPTVDEAGTTTMTTSTENPVEPTPSDFYVMGENFVEITTTANYSGLITVGIMYDDSEIIDEESLHLFHWNGLEWEDATTYVDTVNNVIYGEVDSLSPFFIGLHVANADGPYLVQVGYSLVLDGSASYHPDGTIVDYEWDFGDNTTGTGVLVPHIYTAVGIYDVNLTVTDDRGAQYSDTTMAVVYDPATGSATGGGWFWSTQGNLKRDLESEGKATFGFVVKYKHDVADGNLEFQYHVGDINLKDSEITWLVVSDVSVQFEGTGTINGEGLYTFRVQAKDGDQSDEFTIKIWQGTDTEADPIYQALHAQLGGGNIIIHTK